VSNLREIEAAAPKRELARWHGESLLPEELPKILERSMSASVPWRKPIREYLRADLARKMRRGSEAA
jgi:hypothetical protein